MIDPSSDQKSAGVRPPIQSSGSSEKLVTQAGYSFQVRPAMPTDEKALANFFTHVEAEDLRFRFLTAVRTVGHDQLQAMIAIDHDRTEDFLAFDPVSDTLIATAMLAADVAMKTAEVAIAIRSDYKLRGISWTLLDYLSHVAAAKDIETLESIENRENRQAISLEREMGWTASPCDGDTSLVILRKTLSRADA